MQPLARAPSTAQSEAPDTIPKDAPVYERVKRDHRLNFSTKLYQGIGAVPDTVMNFVFNTFVLLFYNQILGVDALLVSLALAVALAIDALIDPLVGTLSDNLHTAWGRRHPLMLIGAIPLALFLVPIFTPPHLSPWALSAWLLVFVLLTRVCMSMFFVPWAAIAAELSDDYDERTSIMTFRFAVGWAVGVSFPFVVFAFVMRGSPAHPVGQLNPSNYPIMAIAAGLLMSVCGVVTTLLTRREIPYLRRHVSAPARPKLTDVFRDISRALRNDQFALYFILVLMAAAIGGTTANLDIYTATYFWWLTPQSIRWFAISAIGAVLAFPVIAGVQARWDKRDILLATAVASLADGMLMVSLRFLHVLPPNGSPWLLPLLVANGVVASGLAVVLGVIGASVLADILDLHELRTGLRQEAMFNAALSFSGKAVSGVGIVMGGLIVKLIGLPPHVAPHDVSPDVVTRLGVAVGILVPLFYVVPISLIRKLRITRRVHSEIRMELDRRNAER